MQLFKVQPDWTHVVSPQTPFPLARPKYLQIFARKSIHHFPQSNWQKIRSELQTLFRDYCSNSTIHGMSYVGSNRSSLLERLSWLVVFVVSTYCCAWLIQETYHKWDEKPVIVSFSERPTSIWNIPFPAVTVCSEVKASASLMNITESWTRFYNNDSDFNEWRRNDLMAVMQVCDNYFHMSKPFYEEFTNDSLDTVSLLKSLIAVDEDNFVQSCEQGKLDCENMFYKTITEEGICYTYNGLSQEDMFNYGTLHNKYSYLGEVKNAVNWSLENGYNKDSPLWMHPSRGTGDAGRLVLQLMNLNTDQNAFCREAQGFKLLLHSPDEYPMVSKKAVTLPLNRVINVALQPHILTTSEELRKYTPERRKCLFSGERQLRFFRVYNQVNCKLECFTNNTLKVCGCVLFSMPHAEGTRICSTREIRCVLLAEANLLEELAMQRSANPEQDASPCDCMPACTVIQYQTEITQTPYDLGRTEDLRFNALGFHSAIFMGSQRSKLQIYFKDVEFISTRRSELFGITEFVANCGGILGLCLGVSLFSLVELMYYCIVRPLLLVGTTVRHSRKISLGTENSGGRY